MEDGQTLAALFTPNGIFFFQDDPWEVLETHPLKSEPAIASAQICTIVLRPATSTHARISRGRGMAKDFATFYAFQENGLDLMRAEGAATLNAPSPAELTRHL